MIVDRRKVCFTLTRSFITWFFYDILQTSIRVITRTQITSSRCRIVTDFSFAFDPWSTYFAAFRKLRPMTPSTMNWTKTWKRQFIKSNLWNDLFQSFLIWMKNVILPKTQLWQYAHPSGSIEEFSVPDLAQHSLLFKVHVIPSASGTLILTSRTQSKAESVIFRNCSWVLVYSPST